MRKRVLGAVGGVVAIGSVAAAGVVVAMPDRGDGPGAMLAELQEHRETTSHADAADAADDLVPAWTRAVGHRVTIVRPGDAAGDDDLGVRADMDLEPGSAPPASCTPLDRASMPWDGGDGDWPELGSTDALVCDGWVTVVHDGRLYTWR